MTVFGQLIRLSANLPHLLRAHFSGLWLCGESVFMFYKKWILEPMVFSAYLLKLSANLPHFLQAHFSGLGLCGESLFEYFIFLFVVGFSFTAVLGNYCC